jgi:hypothetical protein
MPIRETNDDVDPNVVGLQALAWVLADDQRADRLLTTTGLDAGSLRARIGDPSALAAVLSFVEAHEPDLVALADDLRISPAAVVAARVALERA